MVNLDQERLLRVPGREMLCNAQRDAKAFLETIVWHWKIKSAWFMETSNIIRNCVTRNVKLAELSSWMSWAAHL